MTNKFDIEKFLEEEFDCQRSGSNVIFCCPFCKDTKFNYWFDVDKRYVHKKNKKEYVGLGHCWSCEKKHSVLSFVLEYKKLDLFSALAIVEGEKDLSFKSLLVRLESMNFDRYEFKKIAGLNIPLPLTSSKDLPKGLVKWFVKERSYPKEMLEWFGVRYCWKSNRNDLSEKLRKIYLPLRNRAIFPVTSWKFSAWQAYLFKKGFYRDGKPLSKTYNPGGRSMSNLLFMYEMSKKSKTIVVHEGIFDCLRSFTRGLSPVGILGSSLSPTQAFLLSKTQSEEICIGLDGGVKEEFKAIKASALLDEICDKDITIMRLPHGYDPDDCPERNLTSCFNSRIRFNSRNVIFDSQGKISGYNWPK